MLFVHPPKDGLGKTPLQKMFVNYNLTNFFCVTFKYTRALRIFLKDLPNRLRKADIPRSLELNRLIKID